MLDHRHLIVKVLSYLLLTSGVAHTTNSELTTNTTQTIIQGGVAFSSHKFWHALVFRERSVESRVASKCCA